jgi:hypothetical protein
MTVKKSRKAVSKNTKGKSTSPSTIENSKATPNTEIPPHYDTQNQTPGVNTDVEVAKGTLDDSFQTDSRPKNTV